jgi:hypothetical protein
MNSTKFRPTPFKRRALVGGYKEVCRTAPGSDVKPVGVGRIDRQAFDTVNLVVRREIQ